MINLFRSQLVLSQRIFPSLSLAVRNRNASILSSVNSSPVFVTENHDIYTNLALEHMLYSNLAFEDPKSTQNKECSSESRAFGHPVVLIWSDEPSIVIGRHQNPWLETNLGLVKKLGVKLARRHSGGGCVYHDEGNINISIIGHRNLFENRQENLRFLAQVLKCKYGIECEPNKRHDLIHSASGFKISGSAAKLGRDNCYHHFTLLVETEKEIMGAVIRQNQQDFIKTNSTASTRSKVVNLKDLKPNLTVDQVISDVSQAYGRRYASASKKVSAESSVACEREEYETFNKFKLELQDPEWIYGMTPRFQLERSIDLLEGEARKVGKLIVDVNHGKFERIRVECDLKGCEPSEKFQSLIGTEFNYEKAMINTARLLRLDDLNIQSNGRLDLPNAIEQIFATLLLKLIQDAHF